MPPGDSTTSAGSERPRDSADREQAAAAAVTGFVDRFTTLTTDWLKESATAFNTSFENALKPDYTAEQLAKDVAGMCARNLEYLGSLVQIAVPPSDPRPPGVPPQPVTED